MVINFIAALLVLWVLLKQSNFMSEQDSRVLAEFNNSNSRILEYFLNKFNNFKNIIRKIKKLLANNEPGRYCKPDKFWFPKTHLKGMNLIKTVFLKNKKKKVLIYLR